jgi:hypothetical protein
MKTLFVILFIIVSNCHCLACGCIGQSSVKKEIKRSGIVIVGKILDREDFFVIDSLTRIKISKVKYRIAIKTVYKGRFSTGIAEIITGTGNGDCGFEFEVGKSYIVYANYRNRLYPQGKIVPGYLYTDACKRTRYEDGKELSEIEKKLKPRVQNS